MTRLGPLVLPWSGEAAAALGVMRPRRAATLQGSERRLRGTRSKQRRAAQAVGRRAVPPAPRLSPPSSRPPARPPLQRSSCSRPTGWPATCCGETACGVGQVTWHNVAVRARAQQATCLADTRLRACWHGLALPPSLTRLPPLTARCARCAGCAWPATSPTSARPLTTSACTPVGQQGGRREGGGGRTSSSSGIGRLGKAADQAGCGTCRRRRCPAPCAVAGTTASPPHRAPACPACLPALPRRRSRRG